MDIHEITSILNKKSGYIGIYKESSDARDLRDAQEAGNQLADLVINMQNKSICDFISSYYGYMGGLDAIIFTAGIGEKSPQTREEICDRLSEAFGVYIDKELTKSKAFLICRSPFQSQSLVIPTMKN